jgi:hypothetical protein
VLSFLLKPQVSRKGDDLAKPNYSYEKRRKELARKKKKDEKRQRKLTQKEGGQTADSPEQPSESFGSGQVVQPPADQPVQPPAATE